MMKKKHYFSNYYPHGPPHHLSKQFLMCSSLQDPLTQTWLIPECVPRALGSLSDLGQHISCNIQTFLAPSSPPQIQENINSKLVFSFAKLFFQPSSSGNISQPHPLNVKTEAVFLDLFAHTNRFTSHLNSYKTFLVGNLKCKLPNISDLQKAFYHKLVHFSCTGHWGTLPESMGNYARDTGELCPRH